MYLISLIDSSIYVYDGAKFEPDKPLESKYHEKTKNYKILCSIIEEGSNSSICEKDGDYQTLSKVIRNVYLEGPSGNRTLASKLDLGGQIGVPQLVDSILGKMLHNFISLTKDHLILLQSYTIKWCLKSLGNQTNGFYIESGAYDGEALSNSLYFELQRNYKGQSQI